MGTLHLVTHEPLTCWKMRNNSNFIQRWPKAIFTRSQQAACSYFTATHYKAACKSIPINITSGEQLILGLDNCFKQSIDWKHRCPQLCFLLQPYQVSPITQGASSKQHHKWEEFEHLPLFISVPELLVWFLHIPPSFSSEHPHQRWGHLSCWTTKQLPPAAFPAGLTDLGHHSAKPEHGSAATASPLSQAATQCQAPRWPSCCESTRKTHSELSGTHSSAARPTQCGCWGEQREELAEMMMGAVENNNSKRPSKQCTRFSAVLTCYDFSGFGFTSQVLSALGGNILYKVLTKLIIADHSAGGPGCEGRALRSHWSSPSMQSPKCSWDWDLQGFAIYNPGSREKQEALYESTGGNSSLNTPKMCLPYLWQWVMYMAVSSHRALMSFSLESTSCFFSSLMLRRAASAFTRIKSIFKLPSGSRARIFYEKNKSYWKHGKKTRINKWKENKDKQMILKAGKGNKDNWWNVSFVFTQESWTHRII